MPASHGRQKQLAKQKKKREIVQRGERTSRPRSPLAEIVRLAETLPRGPSFISSGWGSADDTMPALEAGEDEADEGEAVRRRA